MRKRMWAFPHLLQAAYSRFQFIFYWKLQDILKKSELLVRVDFSYEVDEYGYAVPILCWETTYARDHFSLSGPFLIRRILLS